MGGIVFKHDETVYFSDPAKWNEEQIRRFFQLGLTEDAILDKSKGDALAKGLALVQVLWFILQCIARTVQGLPLALLETACLAFTAFNFGIYFFWWHKPVNVTYPLELVCPPLDRYEGRNGERDPRELRSSLAQFFSGASFCASVSFSNRSGPLLK